MYKHTMIQKKISNGNLNSFEETSSDRENGENALKNPIDQTKSKHFERSF